jgi:hypothetical protein
MIKVIIFGLIIICCTIWWLVYTAGDRKRNERIESLRRRARAHHSVLNEMRERQSQRVTEEVRQRVDQWRTDRNLRPIYGPDGLRTEIRSNTPVYRPNGIPLRHPDGSVIHRNINPINPLDIGVNLNEKKPEKIEFLTEKDMEIC